MPLLLRSKKKRPAARGTGRQTCLSFKPVRESPSFNAVTSVLMQQRDLSAIVSKCLCLNCLRKLVESHTSSTPIYFERVLSSSSSVSQLLDWMGPSSLLFFLLIFARSPSFKNPPRTMTSNPKPKPARVGSGQKLRIFDPPHPK